jgi:hypothetical protein
MACPLLESEADGRDVSIFSQRKTLLSDWQRARRARTPKWLPHAGGDGNVMRLCRLLRTMVAVMKGSQALQRVVGGGTQERSEYQ